MSSYESDLLDSIDEPDLVALRVVLVDHEREVMAKTMAGFIAWLESQDPDENVNPQEAHRDLIASARKFRQRTIDQHLARTSSSRLPSHHWSRT